jgi:hypothetical protein
MISLSLPRDDWCFVPFRQMRTAKFEANPIKFRELSSFVSLTTPTQFDKRLLPHRIA